MSGQATPALAARVRDRLARERAEPTAERVAAAVRAEVGRAPGPTALDAMRLVHDNLAGYGLLQPLLADPEVTDVLVSGPDRVWVDRGNGLEQVAVAFADETQVRHLAQRLLAAGGRRLDDAMPFGDTRGPDGIRVHAVLAPIAVGGTVLSLRVPPRRAFTLDELCGRGLCTAPAGALLRDLVAARAGFLVTGGTGAGKTTLLSTLLGLVGPRERLVLVEESVELNPDHPHVVHLQARPANVEGAGEVTLSQLVRQALRMRPDRLVVGEARGAEVVDLLTALNTGHRGGCATLHANSAEAVPARLAALAALAGLAPAALAAQAAAAIDAVVHLTRDPHGGRQLEQVALLAHRRGGSLTTLPAYRWESGVLRATEHAPALHRLLATR